MLNLSDPHKRLVENKLKKIAREVDRCHVLRPTHYLITKIVYLLSPLLSLLILQNPNGDFNKNLPPFLFIPANKSCGRLNNSLNYLSDLDYVNKTNRRRTFPSVRTSGEVFY
uniref:Uncharacterized protein n=1 Tax=Helianthus annuus TaxID=4232 RepID=A0A251SRK2_HELAN